MRHHTLAVSVCIVNALACLVGGDESRQVTPSPTVLNGIDVLRQSGFKTLSGRKIGLITNHTGLTHDGQSTAELMVAADGVEVVTLFSPEHGFAGSLEQSIIADTRDGRTGLKVVSLYGENRRPTAEMVSELDTIVFDIQDIGCRFYTYISTMGEAMRAASEFGLRFVVLDRPNPINGIEVEGPVLDAGLESFVGYHPIPVRHGMTVGELATMFNEELNLNVDLEVIKVENWNRADFFDRTGLVWTNPSPNMRSLTEALLYPGIGLLETTNLSVGRGTDTPFEVVGAPWLDGQQLAAALNHADLAGVRFVPIRFAPDASKYTNEMCGGINILITDRESFAPLLTGWEVARQLAILYPDDWQVSGYKRLLADAKVLAKVREGATVADIQACYQDELSDFMRRRAKFLIY